MQPDRFKFVVGRVRHADAILSRMDIILLTRIDASRNMARFYVVSIEPSLFGDCAVVRNWGRIGTKGRNRIELYARQQDAHDRFNHIIRIKRRRGYGLAGQC